jgi:hypothetical protein
MSRLRRPTHGEEPADPWKRVNRHVFLSCEVHRQDAADPDAELGDGVGVTIGDLALAGKPEVKGSGLVVGAENLCHLGRCPRNAGGSVER